MKKLIISEDTIFLQHFAMLKADVLIKPKSDEITDAAFDEKGRVILVSAQKQMAKDYIDEHIKFVHKAYAPLPPTEVSLKYSHSYKNGSYTKLYFKLPDDKKSVLKDLDYSSVDLMLIPEKDNRGITAKSLTDVIVEKIGRHYKNFKKPVFRHTQLQKKTMVSIYFTTPEGETISLNAKSPVIGQASHDFIAKQFYKKECQKKATVIGSEVHGNETFLVAFYQEKNAPWFLEESSSYSIREQTIDIRPRLTKALRSLYYNDFGASSVFHHLFVELDKDWEGEELEKPEKVEYFHKGLDNTQIDATERCVQTQQPVSILHGPPGTGKSRVLSEVIYQLINRNKNYRILVCSHSNQAVDNLLSKCVEFASKKQKLHRVNNINPQFAKYAETELKSSNIVFSTLHSITTITQNQEETRGFDVCIVDEAGQTLDVDAWMAILASNRLIIAGDHHQLSPLITTDLTDVIVKSDLKTLQARCMENVPESAISMLGVQYRMNKNIVAWSNKTFYDNKIVSHQSVANQTIAGLPPVVFHNITSSQEVSQNNSYMNIAEGDAVKAYVNDLIRFHKIKDSQIGVIVPYAAQRNYMNKIFSNYRNLKMASVDGFQGGEMDVIVISLVRSNPRNTVGFLEDLRRLNVAITRAKKHVCIIGNVDMLGRNKTLAPFFDFYDENIINI